MIATTGIGIITMIGKVVIVAGTSLVITTGMQWYHDFKYSPKKKEEKGNDTIKNKSASEAMRELRRVHQAD